MGQVHDGTSVRAGFEAGRTVLLAGDFGQQSAYHPRGATVWLAYALIIAGLILATTVAAAGARRLRRT